MASPVSDDAFAQFALQHVLATPVQLEAARSHQAARAAAGEPLSLGEALVRTGAITAAQREAAEQRILARQQGGIKQLAHYRLLRKLGEGAMGSVYLAEDVESPGRKVALKVLPRRHAARGDLVKRFQREADAAGRLNHPRIARAFSFAEDQGWLFYVMEYCEGETLDVRLKRGEILRWEEAIRIAIQVAHGLKAAHDLGFVHRDIKPSNILVARDGSVKILDFGLAKNVEDLDSSFRTQSGILIGTPHYMSPEQAEGRRDLDGRADIYSLGASVYHCITGDTPYHGSTAAEVMGRHLSGILADPRRIQPDIPEDVARVVRRMMAREPKDRYRSCEELLGDLERLAAGDRLADAKPGRTFSSGAAGRAEAPIPSPSPSTLRSQGRREPAEPAPGQSLMRSLERKPKTAVLLAVGGATVFLLVLFVLFLTGGTPRSSGRPAPVPAASPDPVPAPVPVPPGPAPVSNPLRDLRESSARRQLDDLRALEQGGDTATDDLIRRFEGFVASYGDTEAGREARGILDRLKAHAAAPPPPPEPAAVARPATPADSDVVDPARWRDARDLLSGVDPAQDTVAGTWRRLDGGLVSNDAPRARIEIPYEPPEEYDVRMEFTQLSGGDSVALYLWKNGHRFRCMVGMNRRIIGFGLIDGKRSAQNPTGVPLPGGAMRIGHRYVLVVVVRNDRLEAWLDGERVVRWTPDYARFSIHADSDLRRDGVMGLYSYASSTHVHRVQVREVTGAGRFLRP